MTSTFAPLSRRKYSICGPMAAVLIGTAIAPIQPQASTISMSSMRLASSSATRSPRPMPAAASVPARRAAALIASRNVQVTSPMVRSGRSPWRSAWTASICGTVRCARGKFTVQAYIMSRCT